MMKPEFPLKIKYENGEEEVYVTPDEVAADLEWFDSDHPDHPDDRCVVLDAQGRRVRVVIEKLELLICELI